MGKVKERRGMNLVIYGKNAAEEALKSSRRIEKVYLQYGHFFEPEFIENLKKKGIDFQWAKKQQLKKLSGTHKHQGIVVLLSPIEYVPAETLFRETLKEKSFFVVLDRITEPQNVGAIARTVEFFGGKGLLLPEKESSPINEVVVKSSSGAILHLMVAKTAEIEESLAHFKSMGGKIISVETGGKDIREAKLKPPTALVVGSEGKGIDPRLISLSDEVVSIPGYGKTPSLNVSAATAVAVWQLKANP